MAIDYGTTVIPSDKYTVVEGGTVQVSAAFEASVTVVGGMDTGTGTATEGSVVEVTSPSDAQSKFGDGSELHEQISLLFSNGASTVHALPVSETSTTESFSSVTSGTLSNTPVFDPNIHDEHSITETTQGDTVNIVYDEGANISTPASGEINLNPRTGEWEAEGSSTNYDFSYDYGDYSSSALQSAADEEDRILYICQEVESIINDAETEVQDNADDYAFSHIVAGAKPFADTSSPDTSGYTDGIDSERVSLVASSLGYIDDAETDLQRTGGAVAGHLARLPLGLSATNNSISGLTGLRTELTPSQAGELIDEQVLPLIDYPPVTIVKDMTTSTTAKFERVYTMQVVDEVTELSHEISREFVGDQNTQENRNQLDRSHRNMLRSLRDDSPPLISPTANGPAFSVSVVQNSSNSNQTDVELGVSPVSIMDTIDVTITVGDILESPEVS